MEVQLWRMVSLKARSEALCVGAAGVYSMIETTLTRAPRTSSNATSCGALSLPAFGLSKISRPAGLTPGCSGSLFLSRVLTCFCACSPPQGQHPVSQPSWLCMR